MARFRLGLAGVLILAFVTAWFDRAQPCCVGSPQAVRLAGEIGFDVGRRSAELQFASGLSSADEQNDDLGLASRGSGSLTPNAPWWRIGLAAPDAELQRALARSTGPPTLPLV